ncbi:MAG: glycosyltransferase family 2 protein [Burkholderiales bacterium]|nr:glycosyltransferase family 2 protein [Burkholderiales bacterium]
MSDSLPYVSVIMPVYNAANYLSSSIESVLNQSYNNFELLIVDDCSTDNSYSILENYAAQDHRIKLFKNAKNSKQAYSRNFAIKQSSGKYLAFLDADDVCVKTRLEQQVQFLETNNNIGLCASRIDFITPIDDINPNNEYIPATHDEIKSYISLFYNPLAQSTVMLKSSILKDNDIYYQESLGGVTEDFTLWINLLDIGVQFAILDQVLVHYRIGDSNQTTALYRDIFIERDREIFKAQILKIAPNNLSLVTLHYDLFLKPVARSAKLTLWMKIKRLLRMQHFARVLLAENSTTNYLNQLVLKKICRRFNFSYKLKKMFLT